MDSRLRMNVTGHLIHAQISASVRVDMNDDGCRTYERSE